MKKVKTVGSVREFVRGDDDLETKIKAHLEKYGMAYKIVGATVFIFTAGGGFDYAYAEAATAVNGLDKGMNALYMKVVNIGKWVIIIKGGFDIIKAVGNGEFDAAKKQFFQYMLIYLLLLGLPWGMEQVDNVFKDLQGV